MKPIPPLARVLYRLLTRVFTLDVTWLMVLDRELANTASSGCQADVTCRLLTPRDVEIYSVLTDSELTPEIANRLRGGIDFCVGVFVAGELASYAWFALESIEAEQNRGAHPASGVGFTFPSHMAFMYKGYTLPDFRGRGLYRELPRAAFELLSSHGVTAILSTADWSNAAALASCTRLGFHPIGRVWVGGMRNVVWQKHPTSTRVYGIARTPHHANANR
ncbi:MAG: GNAT family N-acetyltransferase [Aeoliella sp.]